MYLYSDVLMVDFRELMMMSVVGNIELGPRQAFMANVITPAARTTHSNYMCKKMQEISDGTAPTRVDKLLRQRGDAPSFSAVKKGPFCPPFDGDDAVAVVALTTMKLRPFVPPYNGVIAKLRTCSKSN